MPEAFVRVVIPMAGSIIVGISLIFLVLRGNNVEQDRVMAQRFIYGRVPMLLLLTILFFSRVAEDNMIPIGELLKLWFS